MASIAINMDDTPPSDRAPIDRALPTPPPTRASKWIAKLRTFITVVSGNTPQPASMAARLWQWAARILLLVSPVAMAAGTIMFPCWGDDSVASCKYIDMMLPPMFLGFGVMTMLAGFRARRRKNTDLLGKFFADNPTQRTSSTTRTVFVVIGSIAIVGVTAGMLPTSRIGKAVLADTELGSKKGLVFLCYEVWQAGAAVMFANIFDASLNALDWIGATRTSINRFADTVHSVAADGIVKTMPTAGTAVPAVAQGGDDGFAPATATATPVQQMAVGTFDPRTRFIQNQLDARTKINDAFETAWHINRATNEIFALPLSFIFVTSLLLGASITYAMITNELWNLVGLAVMFPSMAFILLVFVSTAGDDYVNARASLLRPDVTLRLAAAIGMGEQGLFANSLRTTVLGFEIVNVNVFTQRVLYVLGTLLMLGVYVMPK